MIRNMKRIIAAFLASVLLFTDCASGFAAEANMEQSETEILEETTESDLTEEMQEEIPQDTSTEEEPPQVLFEMEELREQSTKQFRLSDGSIVAAQYGMAVHYEDENGELEEIDNRFLYEAAEGENDFAGYRSAEGAVEFKFAPQVQEGELVKITHDDYEVGFELLPPTEDIEENDSELLMTTVMEEVEEAVETEEMEVIQEEAEPEADIAEMAPVSISFLQGELLNPEEVPAEFAAAPAVMSLEDEPEVVWAEVSSLTPAQEEEQILEDMKMEEAVTSVGYGNVLPGVSLQYVLSGSSLKEYILVNERSESYSYDFAMNLSNLEPQMLEDGSILLKDKESGETVYEIPAGYMTDATGAVSEAVTMELLEEQPETGKWVLNITADAEWINAEERVFPVQIDPTMVHSVEAEDSFDASMVTQGHPVESHRDWSFLNAGYSVEDMQIKSFVQLRKLPTLPKNSVVCNATCYMAVGAYSHVRRSRMNIHVKKITGNNVWGTKYTWRNQPEVSEKVMDYQMLHDDSAGQYVGWNITELIKEHYMTANTLNDISGFALEAYEAPEMDGDHWANVLMIVDKYNIYPLMQITYRDTVGVESYYTYQTHGLGNAGTAYIGDYNSQLTLIKSVGSYESTIISYDLNLVYNSSFSDRNFTNDGKNLHTGNFSSARTGPGWKLSAQETVVEVEIEDSSEEGSSTWLVYNDADGTEHYFKQKEGSETEFEDEDGLSLTITKDNINFTMKDTKGNEKFFCAGYLQQIKDANGNIIHIVYNYGNPDNNKIDKAKSNPITSIWMQKQSDETKTEIFHITYNSSGYVDTIEEMYGKKYRIGYGMGSDRYSYPEIIYRLDKNTNTYVPEVSYGYAADDILAEIMDLETKRGVTYGYAKSPTGYRISSWEECAGNNGESKGSRTSVTADELRKTVYRDYGADRQAGTSDDILTTYLFNSAGHTINVYSTDYAGEFLGVTVAAYEAKNGTSKKNNKMSSSITGGQAGVTLLANGSFEKYGSDAETASGWNKSGAGSVVRRNVKPRSGNAHYDMSNSGVATSAVISRTVNLQKGVTYTASAYVDTQGAGTFASDGGVFMKVLSGSSQIAQGPILACKTDADIDDGWQRISVTFTPSAAGNYYICVQWKNASGTIRVDDVQLEEESAPSSYNHVYNAGFEEGADGWTFTGFGLEQISGSEKIHGARSFRAGGYPETKVYAQQTIPLGKDSDTTFLLSGWSKGDSVAELAQNLNDESKKFWGISLTLNYSDGANERHDLPFNEFIHQWQYASMAIVPKRSGQTIDTAIIKLCYYNNANAAFFDCISLTEEPCQTYKYNDKGEIVSVKSTGNGSETYGYNSTQDLISVATAGSGTYKYEYNSRHLPTKVTNDTVSMTVEYDKYGQSTKTTLQHNTDTTVKKMQSRAVYYDGLLTSQTDNTGATTVYTYSGERDLITVTNANGVKIQSYRDQLWDRTDRTYQSGLISVHFGYENGNLTQLKRSGYLSESNKTAKYIQNYELSCDAFGNRKSAGVSSAKESGGSTTSTASNVIETYSYYPGNGNLQKMTYGPLSSPLATVEYTYDRLDRVSTAKYTNTSPQKTTTYGYQYSSDGSLAGITVNGTLGYTYEYDSLGRLIYSAKLQNNRPVLYTNHRYDTSDRIESQRWKVGSDEFSEQYTYSAKDGTLTRMTINGEDLDFTYNKLKQFAKRTSPKLDIEYEYGTRGEFSTNQVAAVRYRKHNETTYRLPRLNYEYDAVGNIISVTPLDKTKTDYTYDNQNQLLTETKGNISGVYSYDTYGNILSKQWKDSNGTRKYTFSYDRENKAWIDQIHQVTFQKDSGTPVTKTLSYDSVGNPTSYYNGEAEWTFSWQNGKQLATAKKAGSSTLITNTYDVDGIRDSKTVGNVKHSYTTLSGKVIRESYGTKTIDYIYDNQGKPYKLIVDDNGAKTVGYYALNLQGDAIAIIDSAGEVAVEYQYDAWGREVGHTTAGDYGSTLYNHNALKYRGYYYDAETGFYYVSSRYYDPEIGRFINADTIDLVLASQTTLSDKNLYAYCDNNPVVRRDESGAIWETVFDVISLAASIAEVAANPKDVWAWAGLVGDAIDLIPVVTGAGEVVRSFKVVNKTLDVIDDASEAVSTTKKLHRPYIRKAVREAVEAKTPRLPDGRFIDLNTMQPIDGKYDLGHISGHEFWWERDEAMRKGWTQKQFNDYMNNPDFYRIEDPRSNRSHKYEKRR